MMNNNTAVPGAVSETNGAANTLAIVDVFGRLPLQSFSFEAVALPQNSLSIV